MTSYILDKIKSKKLRVYGEFKDVFSKELSDFGKTSKDYGKLGPFYEVYLYSFVVGYYSNRRFREYTDDPQTFNMISEWKPGHLTIFKNFLSTLIQNDDIRNEIEFDLLSLSECEPKELEKPINNLISVFEEYANGGFQVLSEKLSEDPSYFSHFLALQKHHEEIIHSI